jgi:hypothetical protein
MSGILNFFKVAFVDLARQFRLSYLPPLMIYVAAGVSGLTGIVGTFFVKDYLNLSAAFLASLGFWAGIPWVLKMPLGHLVDLIWSKKNYLSFFRSWTHWTEYFHYVWVNCSYRNHGSVFIG